MSIPVLTYTQGADLPDAQPPWLDSTGDLIDFSTGYTFVLKIGNPGSTAIITKTTGITGAAGSQDANGNVTASNITIAWATTGELNTLAAGIYEAHLIATRTSDSKQRFMPLAVRINPAIT